MKDLKQKQNRSYPNPRKARKRHKKKRPKPSPHSTPGTVAKRAHNPPSTHPTPSPWKASTAGMQNKDVPRPTPTTHGHQLYRKLVRRPRSPSVLNLTQTPTTQTASRVQRDECIGTATTQIVHSMEACYIAPVGHFHEEHEVPKRVEIKHRRNSNPRRVGKPLNPRSRQIPTKAKRYTQPTQLRTSHNPHGNEERRVNRRSISHLINVEKAGNHDTGGYI
jgi:hypothetical protein